MGKGKGLRCRKCKVRLPKTSRVQKLELRKITLGTYHPPPRAHRHLTKPTSRNGIHRDTPFETKNDNIDQTLESLVSISRDRKSTRLNSSHDQISYAVFCLKKKRRRSPIARWQ